MLKLFQYYEILSYFAFSQVILVVLVMHLFSGFVSIIDSNS